MATQILTPVGRLVQGSLYRAQTTDQDGKPLVYKTGPDQGKPRQAYYFAVAIPKRGEHHWAQAPGDAGPNGTEGSKGWGGKIYAVGHAAAPQAAKSDDFSWKVEDGDSTRVNKKGRRNCDNEGFPGNWIVKFQGTFAPKIVNADGSAYLLEPDTVKAGHYVQVAGTIDFNKRTDSPGVYLNYTFVAHSAPGEEIVLGPDAGSVGFGGVPLPAGALSAPVSRFTPPPLPAMQTVPPLVPSPITPHTQFVTNAAGTVAPPPIPVAPPTNAIPVRTMTPAAQGASYEAMIAAGWTDETLVQHGMMILDRIPH